jgi:hypothetical protein
MEWHGTMVEEHFVDYGAGQPSRSNICGSLSPGRAGALVFTERRGNNTA